MSKAEKQSYREALVSNAANAAQERHSKAIKEYNKNHPDLKGHIVHHGDIDYFEKINAHDRQWTKSKKGKAIA